MPVTISLKILYLVDRRGLSIRLSGNRNRGGNRACERADSDQRENNPPHDLLLAVGDWITGGRRHFPARSRQTRFRHFHDCVSKDLRHLLR